MLGRVCIVSIVVFVFGKSALAHAPWIGLCQNVGKSNSLVGQADIPNGTIGLQCNDHSLAGSALGMNLIPAEAGLSNFGLTPSQLIYIIQSTQTDNLLGSGTIIPYHPVWYLPSWWYNVY